MKMLCDFCVGNGEETEADVVCEHYEGTGPNNSLALCSDCLFNSKFPCSCLQEKLKNQRILVFGMLGLLGGPVSRVEKAASSVREG